MIEQRITSIKQFSEDFGNAFQDVRGALTELLASVNADAAAPQDISRDLGINRNMAWKVAKVINTNDGHDAVQHIPGGPGLNIMLQAFAKSGAPERAIEATRGAVRRFDDMVKTHAGDRSTLELMLSSMAPEKLSQERVEAARKQAYLGNSGIWGVQSKVRLASYFLAPTEPGSEMLDGVVMGGLYGVRRMRPTASVPLFMRQSYHNDDGTEVDKRVEPIDEACTAGDGMMLVPEYCSPGLPSLDVLESGASLRFELPAGPVGNTALMDWTFGWFMRGFVSKYRSEANRVAEHSTRVFVPTERLICDLQIHRSLEFAMNPKPVLYSQLAGSAPYPMWRDQDILPITETIHDIGDGSPVVATPHIPEYSKMVQRVYKRLGWDAQDFHGFRITIKYPPIPSVLILRSDLPERPKGA